MKQNKKQIEANLRNKLAAQYKEKSDKLQQEKAELEKKYNELWRKSCEVREERDKLKEQLAAYEDWNNRLQEFMDMNEEDRVKYVETLRAERNLNDTLDKIKRFSYLDKLFSMAFSV